ncbi:Poly(A) polymerase central domain-containing protein [Haematococcus lacustris]
MSCDEWAPINTDPSSELELKQTLHLQQYLQQRGLYEEETESVLREQLLGTLDHVVKHWVQNVARQCGMSEATAQDANAKIFTFGSYRLGVHAPGADIDILCVGPQYAKRDTHFFGQEPYCLEHTLQHTPGVTEVVAVPRAYVPVLKVKFRGIEMDVLYAALGQFLVPEDLDLQPNSILRGCDDATVRSINGCRVTDTILRVVPDVPTFRLALKTIKLWAEQRAVYSNVAGYLGGVNMALLVARVCRWYPRKAASAIVHNFFLMFSRGWSWPLELHLVPQKHDTLGFMEWNPLMNERDKGCLMPIITPCYPAMNSTYSVTRCTFDVMMAEFTRGFEVCTQILVLQRHAITPWDQLMEPYRFFEVKAAHYIMIEVCASNELDLERWDGWVRSRVRLLVRQLEEHLNVRPFPDAERVPASCNPEDPRPRKAYFLCLTKRAPAVAAVNAATGAVVTAQTYTLQRNAGATGAVAGNANSINITQPVTNFKTQVMAWPERKAGMELRPRALKARDLPGWLYPSGLNPLAAPAVRPLKRPLDSTQPSITATLPSTSPACPADPAASQPVDEAGQPSKHARQGSSGRAGLDEALEELAATAQVPVSVKAEAGQTGPGLVPGSAANGVLGQGEGGPALPASALQLAPDMTRGKEAVKSELEKVIAQVPGLPMQAHGQPACTLTEQAAAGLEGQPGLQARAADDKGDKEGCLTKTCPSVVEVKVEVGEAAQPSPASLDSRASGAQGGVTTPAMPQASVPKPEALVKKVVNAMAPGPPATKPLPAKRPMGLTIRLAAPKPI